MNYINHLIECQCILPIYKNHTKPVYHKFVVFSEVANDEELVEKYVACNNCECIHLVKEVFKSELMWGKDYFKNFVNTIQDIKFNLISSNLENVVNILEENNCEVSIWENVYFLIENDIEDKVTISRKEVENFIIIKTLVYKDKKFTLKTENYQRDFELQ